MRRPSFLQGAIVAGLLGLGASAFVAALLPFVSTSTVARLLVPVLSLAYLAYLLPQSRKRSGRVLILTLWVLMAGCTWLFVPGFVAYVLVHAGALWIVRSLYFYSGGIPPLLDMTVSGVGVLFAFAALHRTGSVFLATWSFFLTQALFAYLPKSLRRPSCDAAIAKSDEFERAREQADAAIRQLLAN